MRIDLHVRTWHGYNKLDAYWVSVLNALRLECGEHQDFASWANDTWKITMLHDENNHLSGFEIDDSMVTFILLKFPQQSHNATN